MSRFRVRKGATTRRHAGLGLGLSIVKHLVELHGGTVRVKSPGEGQGSTFSIDLPLAVVHREEPPEQKRVHPKVRSTPTFDCELRPLDGVTVLVVDDDSDSRGLIRRILEGCRARVLTAGSAEEALAVLRAQGPDVLVSDIGMPDVDGYELLRRVRAEGNKIPAIALTAFARSEDRTKALLAGFAIHVAKPVEPEELLATVASAAGRAGGT